MKFYVGVTNDNWFRFLKERQPEEVNFWRPGGFANFRAVRPGSPFLFKLHSPNNVIVGGGFFVRHDLLPLSLAWDCFGEKNGVSTLGEIREMVNKCRRSREPDPVIGCTILTEPFFFESEDWISVAEDWSSNIGRGKIYGTDLDEGKRLWHAVQKRFPGEDPELPLLPIDECADAPTREEHRWGEVLSGARKGPGTFRVEVTEAYQRRCALTGGKTLPVLDACHIRPFTEEGPNRVDNGLLLRSDLHLLFKRGYVTVTPEHRVEVSRRFQADKVYGDLQGAQMKILPPKFEERPNEEFLRWHNENVYMG